MDRPATESTPPTLIKNHFGIRRGGLANPEFVDIDLMEI